MNAPRSMVRIGSIAIGALRDVRAVLAPDLHDLMPGAFQLWAVAEHAKPARLGSWGHADRRASARAGRLVVVLGDEMRAAVEQVGGDVAIVCEQVADLIRRATAIVEARRDEPDAAVRRALTDAIRSGGTTPQA